jgi:hypothetical protein
VHCNSALQRDNESLRVELRQVEFVVLQPDSAFHQRRQVSQQTDAQGAIRQKHDAGKNPLFITAFPS